MDFRGSEEPSGLESASAEWTEVVSKSVDSETSCRETVGFRSGIWKEIRETDATNVDE